MVSNAATLLLLASASGSLAFLQPTMTFGGISRTSQQQGVGPHHYRRLDDQLTAPPSTGTGWAAHTQAGGRGSESNAVSAVKAALSKADFAEPTVAVLRFDESLDSSDIRPDVVGTEVLRAIPTVKAVIGYSASGSSSDGSSGVTATLVKTPSQLRAFHVPSPLPSATTSELNLQLWQQLLDGCNNDPSLLLFPTDSAASDSATSLVASIERVFPKVTAVGEYTAGSGRSFVTVNSPQGEVTSLRSRGVVGVVLPGAQGGALAGAWAHAFAA